MQFFPVKLYNEFICNFYIVCITIATAAFGNIFITPAEHTSQVADIYHFIYTLAFAPLLSVFRDPSSLGHIHSHVLINAACRILLLVFLSSTIISELQHVRACIRTRYIWGPNNISLHDLLHHLLMDNSVISVFFFYHFLFSSFELSF